MQLPRQVMSDPTRLRETVNRFLMESLLKSAWLTLQRYYVQIRRRLLRPAVWDTSGRALGLSPCLNFMLPLKRRTFITWGARTKDSSPLWTSLYMWTDFFSVLKFNKSSINDVNDITALVEAQNRYVCSHWLRKLNWKTFCINVELLEFTKQLFSI